MGLSRHSFGRLSEGFVAVWDACHTEGLLVYLQFWDQKCEADYESSSEQEKSSLGLLSAHGDG